MTQPTPAWPFNASSIPLQLREQPRWAPWRALWNEKRGKWDKIPCQPNGYGLSTAKPERWLPFDAALAALQAQPERFAGLGYVMTGPHGVVGTDLDGCVQADGGIAPWASEVVDQLGGYAEISPTGRGLRVFSLGDVPEDWANHETGIEVYGGHEPRFLTVTGAVLPGREQLAAVPDGVLASLATRYARQKTSATVINLQMPDLVDELALPELDELELPWQAHEFLLEGKHRGDRSRELFAATVALFSAGLRDDEVLSLLAANPHAMEVALDHRRQDADRALMYLWVEHAQKAKGRATAKVATVDDFQDVSAPTAAKKPLRFGFQAADAFVDAPPMRWLVKGVLPQAEVGALYGPSGSGKTFFALDLALAVAQGLPWRGKRVQQGSVAYVCAEGVAGFRLRLRACSEHHGLPLAGLPLRVLGKAPNLMETRDVNDLVAALRALPEPPALIVIDTLAQVTPGANENSGEDMGRALGHCKVLHQATGAMVLMLHHPGKDEDRGMRGWSGIKGALDVEMQIERSDQHRAATITKMKDGSGEGDEFGFTLTSVLLGQDEDGDEITSCVVQHGAALPKAQRRQEPKGSTQRLVLRTARVLLDLPGQVTTAALIEAAVNEMVPPEEGKRDQRRRHVMVAIDGLAAANVLSVAGGNVRLLADDAEPANGAD